MQRVCLAKVVAKVARRVTWISRYQALDLQEIFMIDKYDYD